MLIEGRELSLIYNLDTDQESYALKDIDITVSPGEVLGFMGPSGSGKSSLLYVLAGLKKPTSGTVYYDDIDIESLSLQEKAEFRKNKFGFIFQRHFLIEYLNVLDNTLVAINRRDEEAEALAMELLEKLGLAKLRQKKPFELSVGQRQRVAVARALINKPSIIFADEPTASLDHKNAMEVMGLLNEYKSVSSILVVTHDRSILENAGRIIEMRDGRFI